MVVKGTFIKAASDYATMITNAIGTQTIYQFDYQTHLKKSESVTDNSKIRKTVQYEYCYRPAQKINRPIIWNK